MSDMSRAEGKAREQTLIEWKTNYWKDPAVAEIYSRLMLEDKGVTRLKNAMEVSLCREYVVGERILDIGAGTGRASLPLAREGFQVTAVDSSQAMLDQYRAQAGEVRVELRVGDARQLDLADGAFDTALGLNVLVHFPNWREILAEWRRVVRPGGRLVFDLYSQDHVDAVERTVGLPPDWSHQEKRFVNKVTGEVVDGSLIAYLNRVRAAELAAVADELGLAIVTVIPYGAVISGSDQNLWRLNTLADQHSWDRLLTWLKVDVRMLEFALFLEREVVGRLTTPVTDHFMVVLDNVADPARNATWLKWHRELSAALAFGIRHADLAGLIPAWDADWKARLNAHLDWPRNRVLFYLLWSCFWDFPDSLALEDFLDGRHLETLKLWHRHWQMDQATTSALRAFRDAPEFTGRFEYAGVDLRGGLEYELTREVLTSYFQAFG